jgi:superfamily I DNA/RNA helicase
MVRVKGRLPQLVTIHSSKGLEYDAAIIIGLESLSFDDVVTDEDRRKLYVALSRARKSVHLLWSGTTPPLVADLLGGGEITEVRIE